MKEIGEFWDWLHHGNTPAWVDIVFVFCALAFAIAACGLWIALTISAAEAWPPLGVAVFLSPFAFAIRMAWRAFKASQE